MRKKLTSMTMAIYAERYGDGKTASWLRRKLNKDGWLPGVKKFDRPSARLLLLEVDETSEEIKKTCDVDN